MRIAVLGTGDIGGTLGVKWAQAGHRVTFGSRDPDSQKVKERLGEAGGSATAATMPDAVAESEAVLFAIPHAAMESTVMELASDLDEKLLIDATNNFGAQVINNLVSLQRHAPKAQIFRAFNALGWEIFADPVFGDTRADLFYCGPEGESRASMEALIQQIGLQPVWIGGLEMAPAIDALGTLWVTMAFRRSMGRDIALKLLQR